MRKLSALAGLLFQQAHKCPRILRKKRGIIASHKLQKQIGAF